MTRLIVLALAFAAAAAGARAELPAPEGPVILTVRGNITETNAPGAAELDRAMLERMGWVEIETHTSFTVGPQRFAGVPLRVLLEALGAKGDILAATALNDYAVGIPAADAEAHDVLLALDHDGRPMRVRDKGPIWIVYPLDEGSAETRRFDDRMIWQLKTLDVR